MAIESHFLGCHALLALTVSALRSAIEKHHEQRTQLLVLSADLIGLTLSLDTVLALLGEADEDLLQRGLAHGVLGNANLGAIRRVNQVETLLGISETRLEEQNASRPHTHPFLVLLYDGEHVTQRQRLSCLRVILQKSR